MQSSVPLWLLLLLVPACGGIVRFSEADDGSSSTTSSAGGSSSSTTSTNPSGVGGGTPDEAKELVANACPDIASEPHFCVMFSYPNQLFAVGTDTGNICHLGDVSGLESTDASSIAVIGTEVHACSYEDGVFRASILGGPAELADVECEALTEYQGGLLMLPGPASSGALEYYPTFEAIGAEAPEAYYPADGLFSRITVRGDTLFGAWHSTAEIERHELSLGTLDTLQLEGFDDWVHGMSVTADGRLYVLSTDRILAFDADTGSEIDLAPMDGGIFGALHCWSN